MCCWTCTLSKMAYYYGYNDNTEQFTRVLRYEYNYASMGTTTFKQPTDLLYGNPHSEIYGCNLTAKSRIILLAHTFDSDSVIGDELKILYELTLIKRDGTEESFDIKEIEMKNKRLGNTRHFLLNEEIVISDLYKGDLWNIALMRLRIKRTSNKSINNESNVSLLVEY